MAEQRPLTPGAKRALEALRNQPEPITLKDLNEQMDEPLASAHLTALKKRGLVETAVVEVPVTRIQKVNTYVLTDAGTDFEE